MSRVQRGGTELLPGCQLGLPSSSLLWKHSGATARFLRNLVSPAQESFLSLRQEPPDRVYQDLDLPGPAPHLPRPKQCSLSNAHSEGSQDPSHLSDPWTRPPAKEAYSQLLAAGTLSFSVSETGKRKVGTSVWGWFCWAFYSWSPSNYTMETVKCTKDLETPRRKRDLMKKRHPRPPAV